MKILVFGSDSAILDHSASVTQRAIDASFGLDKYSVIVPSSISAIKQHQENLWVYGINAKNKIIAAGKIYHLADQLLKKEKFDLITTPDAYYLALAGWLLAKKYQTKLEVQVHGFEKLFGFRKLIAKFVLPKADAVRVVSQRLRRMMAEDFKVEDNRITVVPVFSPPYTSGADQSLPPEHAADKFVFLTVSRLVPIKNILLQIEAFAEVVQAWPQAELWIAGEGPEKNRLAAQIDNLGLVQNVKLLGQKTRSELDSLYRQADVFLLTSFAEGWPIVIMEAARYRLPIIMTNVGSAGELIINQESGLVIPVNDKSALISAMKLLIGDRELRTKIGLGAFQAVNGMLNKEEIIKLYQLGWQRAVAGEPIADSGVSNQR